MYDFALYENVTTGINHQKDLHIIARLLKDSGFSVCVLGYCKEQDFGDGTPFIPIDNPYRLPEMESGPKWTFFYRKIRFLINRRLYIRHFLIASKGIASNYYCGSFLKETDSRFLRQPTIANYFFWGLRSHYVRMSLKDWLHPWNAVRKIRKISLIKKSRNIKFFISNELIRKEFNDCGISSDRIVIRPERFVQDDYMVQPTFEAPFCFLSIGTIRQEKRIPMAISAFKKLPDKECRYDIAGRCNNPKLNNLIKNLTKDDANILRDERRLSEEEYQGYFERCHFLVLCDVQQQSSVTNGTMMEALLMGKPIIAPNYHPYKYYVEKYHIGVLFDGNTEDSLQKAMNEALETGAESFQPALQIFRQLFIYGNIQNQFKKELNGIGLVPQMR